MATSTLACGTYTHHGHGRIHHHGGGGDVALIAVGVLAGAAIVSSTHRDPPPEPVYVNNVYYNYGPPPPPLPRSPRDAVPTSEGELPAFDPQAARAALNQVDVTGCDVPTSAVSKGFGHAKVTINPDGRVSKVVVDEPAGLSAEAARCIGDRFGAVTVAPFRGNLVTMGASFVAR